MSRSGLSILLVAALAGCDSVPTPPEPPEVSLDAQLRASLQGWGVVPIGEMPAHDPAQVALGRALFFDKILSGNRDVACATCHDPAAGLADGRSLAVGTGGLSAGPGPSRALGAGRRFTPRGAISLLNAGLGLPHFFWDARLSGHQGGLLADSSVVLPPGLPHLLAAQAMLPVLNRTEMRGEPGDHDVFGATNELALVPDHEPALVWDRAMKRLLAVQEYVALFQAAFPGVAAPRFEHAARALAAFQRAAFTHTRSPFDRYLDRDDLALTPAAKRGGILFFGRALCSSCHNGPFLGGQGFANVGAPQVGPGGQKQPPRDLGLGEHREGDVYRFAFRVAPLRNVELTAPYFHSGAYPALEAVVRHYLDLPTALTSYDPAQLAPDVRPYYRGDPGTIAAVLATLDGRLRQPMALTEGEVADLVAFLRSLTDPAARDLRALVPARVPSGLPVP